MTRRGRGSCAASSSSVAPGEPAGGAAGACRCRTCRAYPRVFAGSVRRHGGSRLPARGPERPQARRDRSGTRAGLRVVVPADLPESHGRQQGAVVVRFLPDRGPGSGVAGGAAGYPCRVRGGRRRLRLGGGAIRQQRQAVGQGLGARARVRHGGDQAAGNRAEELRGAADGVAGREVQGRRGGRSNAHIVAVLVGDGLRCEEAVLNRGQVFAVGGLRGGVPVHGPDACK